MPEFVTVTHPDLPGQTARMVNPRNGWARATEDNDSTGRPDKPAKATEKVRTPSTSAPAEQDSPTAGPSTTPEKE